MPRARQFDVDQAVDQALHLFWSKGYEGTTLADLTEALGINRPSLYAAFGSKEELFQRAVQRYVSGPTSEITLAIEAPTPREAAARLMRFYADAAGRPNVPRGCLLVQGALVCGSESDGVRSSLVELRHATEEALARRFEKAKKDGLLDEASKPRDLARFVWTVCYGLTIQSVGGATRDQLRRVADIAIQAWPA